MRRMMTKWFLGLSAIALLTLADTAAAQSTIEGTYVLVDVANQRTQALAAVKTGTRELTVTGREVTQMQIEEMLRPAPRLIVRREGDNIVVRSGSIGEQRSKNDFSASTTAGGWALRQRIVNGVLERRLERAGWVQIYRYSLGTSRATMYVDAEITGPSMAAPVRTRLRYARQ